MMKSNILQVDQFTWNIFISQTTLLVYEDACDKKDYLLYVYILGEELENVIPDLVCLRIFFRRWLQFLKSGIQSY